MVVLHYTGMESSSEAATRLCNPHSGVSAHYLLDENGTVYRLVAESCRAWHAGVSCWAGDRNINDRSIGIELVNPGHEHGYRPFPEPQMRALESLLRSILDRHGISPTRVLGHSDVAPERKTDPGELFDWVRLARRELAVWPSESPPPPPEASVRRLLQEIGYDGEARLEAVIAAFQRHFVRDSPPTGDIDTQTLKQIAAVHHLYRPPTA